MFVCFYRAVCTCSNYLTTMLQVVLRYYGWPFLKLLSLDGCTVSFYYVDTRQLFKQSPFTMSFSKRLIELKLRLCLDWVEVREKQNGHTITYDQGSKSYVMLFSILQTQPYHLILESPVLPIAQRGPHLRTMRVCSVVSKEFTMTQRS